MRLQVPILGELSQSAFVRKVATFQAGFLVATVIGMATSVVYPALLGPTQYGLFAVVSALAGLLSIAASFGQEATLTTFLSEAVGKKDQEAIKRVLGYYVQVSLLGLVLYAILIAIAPTVGGLQGDSAIGMYAQIVLLNAALQSPAVLLFMTLQLAHKIRLITILENVRTLLQFGLSTLLIFLGWNVAGIFVGTIIISALYVPLSFVLYARYAQEASLPGVVGVLKSSLRTDTRPYFLQGFWISVDRSVVSNLHPNLLIMLLNSVAPLEVVGITRLALRLATLPSTFLSGSISRVAAVSVPQLLSKDPKSFASSAVKLIVGSVSVHAVAVLGAAIGIPLLLPYVYGQEFAPAIVPVLIMLPLNLFTSSHMVSIPLLRLTKKIYMNTLNFVIGLTIAIALFLVLLKPLHPAAAFACAVLYVHAHGMLIYVYLWQIIFRKRPTVKSVSELLRTHLTSRS